jgi:hypothetical protein
MLVLDLFIILKSHDYMQVTLEGDVHEIVS